MTAEILYYGVPNEAASIIGSLLKYTRDQLVLNPLGARKVLGPGLVLRSAFHGHSINVSCCSEKKWMLYDHD